MVFFILVIQNVSPSQLERLLCVRTVIVLISMFIVLVNTLIKVCRFINPLPFCLSIVYVYYYFFLTDFGFLLISIATHLIYSVTLIWEKYMKKFLFVPLFVVLFMKFYILGF